MTLYGVQGASHLSKPHKVCEEHTDNSRKRVVNEMALIHTK